MNEESPENSPRSAFWLAFRVLDEPGKVFQSLAFRPRSLIPIVLLILVTGIVAFGTPEKVLQDQIRAGLESIQGQLSEEQLQQQVDAAATTGKRALILGTGSAGGVVALVVVAAVLMLIFGATSDTPIRFKEEFAIVAHANVAALAGAVLLVGLTNFAGFDQLQLSLGFLFDKQDQAFLFRFANQITVFGAWNMILIAVGNKILTKAQGLGVPLAIVGGLWITSKLLFATIGGLLGGLGG